MNAMNMLVKEKYCKENFTVLGYELRRTAKIEYISR